MIADRYDWSAMPADLLLRGGPIYTMDTRLPRCRALAIVDGQVAATGNRDADLDSLRGPATRVVDLNGRAVVPGFVDAHIHFASFGLTRQQVNLDASPTLEDGLRLLREASERLAPGAWLRGRGWDRNRWGRLPTAGDLDAAIGDRPAALASHDGHSVWLSSAALRSAGIDRNVPNSPGGVIERDLSGEPTGVLSENAQDLVRGTVPDATDDEVREAIRQAMPIAAAAGLSGLHNFEDSRSRRAFQTLEAAGDLTLRVYHGVPRGELRKARDQQLRSGVGSDLFRIGPVKLFADGALGSRTAHLLQPYEGRADGYRGVPTLTADELADEMRHAADASLDLAVHAIGDAAVRAVLNAYATTRTAYPPLAERLLRIEHAQLIQPDDLSRFRPLGAIASMQPSHAVADRHTADRHWGARAEHGYAWRAVLDAGATLAFGTDAPVESIEPLFSLHAATTRGGWYAEQALTLEEAVRAYTLGSAMAERASQRRGRLTRGMDADLVVLSCDPFVEEADALLETRVDLTVVSGRITFQGGDL
jgi:predicted amidohydrolase YtcJ